MKYFTRILIILVLVYIYFLHVDIKNDPVEENSPENDMVVFSDWARGLKSVEVIYVAD